MTRTFDEFRTVYSDGFGAEFEAIQLSWDRVKEILGRDHDGNGEDDARLIQALREMGAPEWIDEAEGWVDEYGWGLIGPPAVRGRNELLERSERDARSERL